MVYRLISSRSLFHSSLNQRAFLPSHDRAGVRGTTDRTTESAQNGTVLYLFKAHFTNFRRSDVTSPLFYFTVYLRILQPLWFKIKHFTVASVNTLSYHCNTLQTMRGLAVAVGPLTYMIPQVLLLNTFPKSHSIAQFDVFINRTKITFFFREFSFTGSRIIFSPSLKH
jgi:hypothetical protein